MYCEGCLFENNPVDLFPGYPLNRARVRNCGGMTNASVLEPKAGETLRPALTTKVILFRLLLILLNR
jgi:hypothetical protein